MRGAFLAVIGFVAAILAASAVLTFGALWPFFGVDQIEWLAGFTGMTAFRLGQLAVGPLLLAIAFAEFVRARTAAYWLGVWVALAIAAQALPWLAFGDLSWRLLLYGIAGLVAGSVYWLIAGRGILREAARRASPAAIA